MAIEEFTRIKLLADLRSDKTGAVWPAGTVATIVDVAETYYTAEVPYNDEFDLLELEPDQVAPVE